MTRRIRRIVLLLLVPTVWDIIVQACRYVSCRSRMAPAAVDAVWALCHPTGGATP